MAVGVWVILAVDDEVGDCDGVGGTIHETIVMLPPVPFAPEAED